MIRCNQCGETLTFSGVEVLMFKYDGSDKWCLEHLHEYDNEAVSLDLERSWTGYEFDDDDEDKRDSIRCPRCHKYPFRCKELQTYDFVKVVMFDEKPHKIEQTERSK